MKVYVMRHGTTVWNEKGIFQGHKNNRLSLAGKLETEQVSLKYKDIKFDIIFSSPLMRTVQTANIMNKYHKVKIIKDNRLIEIDKGIFAGRRKNSLTQEEKILKEKRDVSTGMESKEHAMKRISSFIEYLKETKLQIVLIITHKWIAEFIEECLLKKNTSSFKNAEIRCFDL